MAFYREGLRAVLCEAMEDLGDLLGGGGEEGDGMGDGDGSDDEVEEGGGE